MNFHYYRITVNRFTTTCYVDIVTFAYYINNDLVNGTFVRNIRPELYQFCKGFFQEALTPYYTTV